MPPPSNNTLPTHDCFIELIILSHASTEGRISVQSTKFFHRAVATTSQGLPYAEEFSFRKFFEHKKNADAFFVVADDQRRARRVL